MAGKFSKGGGIVHQKERGCGDVAEVGPEAPVGACSCSPLSKRRTASAVGAPFLR